MITRWGMGTLGLAAFQADEEQSFLGYELTQGRDYSEATAARSMRMCERCLKNAMSLFDSCCPSIASNLTPWSRNCFITRRLSKMIWPRSSGSALRMFHNQHGGADGQLHR